MPTRQDQLHSYQFMIQRVVAALVMRETDPPQSPFRRAAGATVAGVMVAALALTAIAVYGVLSPGGGTGWRDGAAIIVERESGARFVYRAGKLHPVVNYASARLILGSAAPETVYVARASIAGAPRGVPLGIPGAPDPLPGANSLLGAPWTLCSRGTESVLLVGPRQIGGRPLAEAAVLARHPDGSAHLIWHHRRHLVRDPAVTLTALSWGSEPLAPIAPALLNVLPAGADLARIPVPDRGRRSARVPGARNGEVFLVESQGGGRQYAVALRDGLATITQVQADLLIGDPLTASLVGQTSPRRLGQGEYAVLPKLGPLVPANDLALPPTTPVPVRLSGGLCGLVRGPDGVAKLLIDVAVPDVEPAIRTGSRTGTGMVLADRVLVPPGRGAVVEALASPGAPSGAFSVVTDLGLRHEVSGPEVLPMLGFANIRPVRLPAGVVTLLPAGRALDPGAALAPVIG